MIAGTGGMGQATGLLLRELGDFDVDLYLGDADAQKAREAAEWICLDSSRCGAVEPFLLPLEGTSDGFDTVLRDADLLLDCLPGEEATRMARLARGNRLHYANLTEYVKATNEITELAQGAEQG
ncbi:MAG: saccharopine dehydrogenase NADP-binding domain-containing protein, partial [Thermoanaerobaculia bacterium]